MPAGPDGDCWVALWADADQALYGRSNTLPDDWVVRAEAALEDTRVPGWQPFSLFHPDNLLPWLAGPQARISQFRCRENRLRAYPAALVLSHSVPGFCGDRRRTCLRRDAVRIPRQPARGLSCGEL